MKSLRQGSLQGKVSTAKTIFLATIVLTSSVLGGGEEQEGGRGIMPQVGSMEAPQASYVAAVENQIPQYQGYNFQQMNQSLMYGTLSPQFLMGQMG